MDRRQALRLLAGAALCPCCIERATAADGPHWSYEGDAGPSKWGDLDAASKTCAIGTQQSPVDIVGPVKAQLPALRIDWPKRADTIINNGHTIQLNFGEGNSLLLGESRYNLLQLHFHRPSEHLVGGKSFAMEAHFVHRAAEGSGLAVVGVLMTEGAANEAFAKITTTMPAAEGPAVKADAAIDPNALLPAERSYYRYPGSLTTPPCAEIVEWLVLTTPISIAEADIASFAKVYAMNARPAQKDNRRAVLVSM
jgi:carbonic anhydrase